MSHPSHSKCGMTRIQQAGKQNLLILKSKVYSFQAIDISCMELSLQKITHMFGFWVSQSLKLNIITSSSVTKLFFVPNSFEVKPKTMALLKRKCELRSFTFQILPIQDRLLVNQCWGFEQNLRCLKQFSYNLLNLEWFS